MTRSTRSRVKYLHRALQEAHKEGNEQAVKRLTARITRLMMFDGAPPEWEEEGLDVLSMLVEAGIQDSMAEAG